MIKKITAFILLLIIAISCLPSNTFAVVNNDHNTVPDTVVNDDSNNTVPDTVIYVESTYCIVGKTVDVNINITNNPGISGAKFSISFDNNLTLVGVSEEGGAFKALDYTAPETLSSPCFFNWDSLNAVSDNDGTIVTLTFEASPESVNENLDINISYNYGDIYDADLNSIVVTMVSGSLNVIDYIPGDVNGDGIVSGKDVTLIRRYNAGIDVEINTLAADVNSDGVINGKDVTLIRRYQAGWNVKLLPGEVICEHSLTSVEAKEATCTESGNTAYWMCSVCGKYFSDENATNELSLIETVIPAKGHTEVVDEAVAPSETQTGLTEGSHCDVCGETIVAQEIVEMLPPTYHAIIYGNLQGAESPTITRFAEHEGIMFETVPDPVRLGYNFLGWYTASEGGTKVDKIEAGTKENVTVYAHWELITYTITYKDAPVKNNPSTYTMEDKIILANPEWSGLMFVNWTDENGNIVSTIEKGTTGNIILTANWKSYRNNVVPAQNSKVLSAYRDDMGLYYFAYKLGTIENVVISPITDSYNKTTSASQNLTLTNTISTSEDYMSTIATTINESTTHTDSWNETITEIKSKSKTKNFTNTLSLEANIWKIGVKETAQFGITWGGTETDENSTVTGWSESTTTSSSFSTSSTISFAKTMSMTASRTISIPGEMPNGLYDYVYTTDVIVYGIVIYDPNEGNYCVGTYSALGDLSTTLMYYKRSSDKYDYPCDDLPFNIDTNRIEEIVESFYYVQYDANGGDGYMPASLHEIGNISNLSENKLTKAGYTFNGWELRSDNQTVVYDDKQSIIDLAPAGETVTLYAKWSVDPYTIGKYVENESIVSDSDGGKPYIVYNDIEKTPQSVEPGYIYIIDWSKYTGTVDYIESVTQADGTRYGGGNFNHDINSIDEVYFIGNSSVTFTNMILFHVNYSQYSTVPTIHFKDFNIVDSAFYVWAPEETMHRTMILDIQGECSIKAPTGCKAISGFKKITFEGSGILEVHGGRGADATTPGGNGQNGSCGIEADSIVVDMTGGALIVHGGNGGKGAKGIPGLDGETNDTFEFIKHVYGIFGAEIQAIRRYNKAGNGGDGGKGGAGGNGGKPIECATIVSNGIGTVRLIFGDGGDGGTGGDGGKGGDGHNYYGYADGVSYLHCWDPGEGGDAGNGGDGGDAGHASTEYYSLDCENVEIVSGKNGTPGTGGQPGEVGNGGAGGETHATANDHYAEQADPGEPGKVGNPGKP